MRFLYEGITRDQSGNIITNATVSVYLTGTTTVASIYITLAGTTAFNTTTSNSSGRFTFYRDAFDYGTEQLFDISFTKDGYDSQTYTSLKGEVVMGSYGIATAKTASYPMIIPYGVLFVHSAGGSIAFSGAVEIGLYQVFSGFDAGDVTFGAGVVGEVNPQWFETLVSGTTNAKVAMDSAVAAAPIGGTVRIPLGKWVISTAWAFSKQVNLKGHGPGSILWISGLAGSDAITFGPAAGYMYGVHWQDFAILGGATCAANGLVIRNVNNSVFDNIHVMLGSTVASVWIKTFGIINKYNFTISSNMIASYAYTPTIQTGKAIYCSGAGDVAGTFVKNEFNCIIEGGPGYGLHLLGDASSGSNTIKGTYEGITGEFAVLVEGGTTVRITELHLEATLVSTNMLKILNHSWGYIGPEVFSIPITGCDDIQLVNADKTIIDGVTVNRLLIDANSDQTTIRDLQLFGLADSFLTDSGTNTRYWKLGKTTATVNATPITVFTPSGFGGLYQIVVLIANAGAEYLATANLLWDGTTARITSDNGALLTLTLAGNAVQVTQTSGGAANVIVTARKVLSYN